MVIVDLRTAAAAEGARLTAARALSCRDDEPARASCESDGPWITVCHGSRLRRSLGRRALLIWRIAIEDATGRLVESELVGVAVRLSTSYSRLRGRASVEAFLRALEVDVCERLDASSKAWRKVSQEAVRAFAAARRSRERAIAAFAEPAERFQAGLFDRRAHRHQSTQLAAAADAARCVAERLSIIEQTATLVERRAELLLVLLP